MENSKEDKPVFDLDAMDSQDEARMQVMVGDRPTGWYLIFAGPGHPLGIAQTNRVAREELQRNRAIEQARANGKKYKAEDKSPEQLLDENVDFVMERLIGWTEVKMNGEPFPFTRENAIKTLKDKKKSSLLAQAIEFIISENSFMKRSAKS
jgi:hypothetical protein